MTKSPIYFIGKEIKITTLGEESHLFYVLEKLEYSESKQQIIETTIASTQHGDFQSLVTLSIGKGGTFISKDQMGSFEATGTLFGQPGNWNIITFDEALVAQTKEKFTGSYIFLKSGVRAMKRWSGISKSRPIYFTFQEGKYISKENFNHLFKNPKEIPKFYANLVSKLDKAK